MHKKMWCLVMILPLFCATLATAQDDKKETKEDIILKRLAELQKTLDGIEKDLRKDVEKNKEDIKEMKKTLEAIMKDLDALKKGNSNSNGNNGKLKTFKVEETRVKKTVPKYDDDDDDTITLKPPPKVTVRYNPSEVQYGKVRIVNTYHLDQTVVVNGDRYTVRSGESYTVDYICAGEFTYRVIGIHSYDQRRTLIANEVFTVRIFPKPPLTYCK